MNVPQYQQSHLDELESEAIHIIRESVAEAENPAMLYSIGKDSTTLVHLARKAFYPAPLPFPLVHIDTLWKFKEMIRFRDEFCAKHNIELRVHTNPEGRAAGVGPYTHGSKRHTDIMKTQALLQALNQWRFDMILCGARRDEEKSRAKERIYSFRDKHHQWDPKRQRPELWELYNTRLNPEESMRVFPISNWTELDVWQYIQREDIPVVSLYFAKQRPIVEINGDLILVDDDRVPLEGREVKMRRVRFRTLGCYPLTGGVESEADNLDKIIEELMTTTVSERLSRVIDHDSAHSMERKKREGYF